MGHLSRLWYRLRASFWFIPGAIVAGATLLALVAIEADSRYVGADALSAWPRLFGAGTSASRSLLTAIAGSMITVASTVFSITLVALSLASSQYSPRVLRNFMRDRTNQTVLGVFVGIFAYCLVVLRSIYGDGDDVFLPSVAVLLGLLLGFGGIGILVFFIHHIAQSIQASEIVDAVRRECFETIDRLFPDTARPSDDDPPEPIAPGACHELRRASGTGYLQFVDHARLRDLARVHDVRLIVHPRVGDYVLEGDRLLSCIPIPGAELGDAVAGCWSLGAQRTLEQDIGFGLCIDALTAVLARLASRRLRFDGCDDDGVDRVEPRHPRFDALLAEAFDQIRDAARGDTVVLDRLRWALEAVASRAASPARARDVQQAVARLRHSVQREVRHPEERDWLLTRIDALLVELPRA